MKNVAESGAGDFDFLIGTWRVTHRRLTERLANCTEWAEFVGTMETRKILCGLGNIDDTTLDLPGGTYYAAALRAFDDEKKLWSIWWLDGRHPGTIEAPMVGRFENGAGTFYADEMFAGRPIRVRFMWTMPVADGPRWEQAFSVDGGATWETNWVMDFARA
jgi:hypothetical protein